MARLQRLNGGIEEVDFFSVQWKELCDARLIDALVVAPAWGATTNPRTSNNVLAITQILLTKCLINSFSSCSTQPKQCSQNPVVSEDPGFLSLTEFHHRGLFLEAWKATNSNHQWLTP